MKDRSFTFGCGGSERSASLFSSVVFSTVSSGTEVSAGFSDTFFDPLLIFLWNEGEMFDKISALFCKLLAYLSVWSPVFCASNCRKAAAADGAESKGIQMSFLLLMRRNYPSYLEICADEGNEVPLCLLGIFLKFDCIPDLHSENLLPMGTGCSDMSMMNGLTEAREASEPEEWWWLPWWLPRTDFLRSWKCEVWATGFFWIGIEIGI